MDGEVEKERREKKLSMAIKECFFRGVGREITNLLKRDTH